LEESNFSSVNVDLYLKKDIKNNRNFTEETLTIFA